MIRKIVSIVTFALLIFCMVLIKSTTEVESISDFDLSVAKKDIVTAELLKEAKQMIKENYKDIEISDNINIYIIEFPFGIDGLTQYTNGTNGIANIYMSTRILNMSHDTAIHRVLHELIHAISRDSIFEEDLKEGLAESIAKDLCIKNKYSVNLISAYEIESKIAKKYKKEYGQEFYAKYLQRDWTYFEEIKIIDKQN